MPREPHQAARKRLHYLLTPKGIAEKSALTYRYIKRSYQFFTETREKIGQSLRYLENEGIRSIVLYKATVLTEMAVLVLLDTNLELMAIVDDDKAGQQFLGQKIQPVKSIKDMVFDRIVITTGESVEEVAGSLSDHGVTKEKICSLQSMEDDQKNKHGIKDKTPARRDIAGLLKELKEALHKIYGKNLIGLYLYGSYATQEEDSESDVDVAIILKDFTDYWEEVQRTGHVISELSLKYNVSISPIRLREADWAQGESPFLRNVRKEHVPI